MSAPPDPTWYVSPVGDELRLAYGPSGPAGHFPQVAVLHRRDGFFRLAPPGTTWGTSAILPPALWTGGRYVQGAPVVAAWRLAGRALLLALGGAPGGLPFVATVRLGPPADGPEGGTLGGSRGGELRAAVRVCLGADGARVPLDPRPGEGAKLVTLSSMRVSRRRWDAQEAHAGKRRLTIPAARGHAGSRGGWLAWPPMPASTFALLGGSSAWKAAAPTVEVRLDRRLTVTGWLTPSRNPNGDNLSLWAAAPVFPPAWRYTLTARRPSPSGEGIRDQSMPKARRTPEEKE